MPRGKKRKEQWKTLDEFEADQKKSVDVPARVVSEDVLYSTLAASPESNRDRSKREAQERRVKNQQEARGARKSTREDA